MKKLLFLLLIFIPAICLGSAFKPSELKVHHYYYILFKKTSFVEKAELLSKRNNIYLFKYLFDEPLPFWKLYQYKIVKLDQIIADVN